MLQQPRYLSIRCVIASSLPEHLAPQSVNTSCAGSIDNVMSDKQDVNIQQTGSASERGQATDRDTLQASTSRPLLRFETGVAVAGCGPVAGVQQA